jgi:hypothetical protein
MPTSSPIMMRHISNPKLPIEHSGRLMFSQANPPVDVISPGLSGLKLG